MAKETSAEQLKRLVGMTFLHRSETAEVGLVVGVDHAYNVPEMRGRQYPVIFLSTDKQYEIVSLKQLLAENQNDPRLAGLEAR